MYNGDVHNNTFTKLLNEIEEESENNEIKFCDDTVRIHLIFYNSKHMIISILNIT